MNRFLRTFPGRRFYNASCSYARFPYEELENVLNHIQKSDMYGFTKNIGMHELDGNICVYTRRERPTQYCCFRRKNGEDCWNVCMLMSYLDNFSEDTMKKFLDFIGQCVDIKLPQNNFEYIPPLSDQVVEKYTEKESCGLSQTDSTTIREAEEMEKKWLEKMSS